MAIVERIDEKGWLIDHQLFLNNLYEPLHKRLIHGLFDIKTPFMMDEQAKKLATASVEDEESTTIKKRKRKKSRNVASTNDPLKPTMEAIIDEVRQRGAFQPSPGPEIILQNNKPARQLANQVMAEIVVEMSKMHEEVHGNNALERPIFAAPQNVLLPAKCEYHMCDIAKITDYCSNKTFDLIIMDPPWENKHVKRHKWNPDSYKMMTNHDICNLINIPELIDLKNGHLVIWCTNSPRHIDAIGQWLNKWHFVKKATWHWLKVIYFYNHYYFSLATFLSRR
jgi:hypothetical protein